MEQIHLKSLLKPQAYPEPTTTVQLLQTHISFILLTDQFVYKIKKAVDFEFLNFTTLDRRRFYCDEEVRLNRRLCPDIYLGVVELRESPSGACFYGDGRIIDYAVKMKRLPDEKMLHRLLDRNDLGEADIRRIARTIGEFHLKAERSDEINRIGGIAGIRRNWEENFQQLVEFVGRTLTKGDLEIIRTWVEQFIINQEELFNRRATQGFIRECDGDIHLENICLAEKVYIFDCIEFNRRFSCSDTAADISFLLMDMEYHYRNDLAKLLLEEYIKVTQDYELPQLVDFYKLYRAVVRGKVTSFLLQDQTILPENKILAGDHARRYFRLARGYILRQKLSTCLIITSGLMGSGKSSLTAEVSMELGLTSASSDAVRKKIAAVPLHENRHEEFGQGIYSSSCTDATYGELLRIADHELAHGRSVMIDASFSKRSYRDNFRNLAMQYGVRFLLVHTFCDEQETEKRLNARTDGSLSISDGRWELFPRQKDQYENILTDEGEVIHINSNQPLTESVDAIMKNLGLLPCGLN
jgi:aminoglycoside phosphotransferase family enzyme/predicted kinase